MAQLDLERLREAVLDGRSRGADRPREARRRVFVDPGGRVVISDEEGDERMLSEVHTAVFASTHRP